MDRYSTSEQRRGVRRGAWTQQEDALLAKCVARYGEGEWKQVPLRAGLNRCRKSCRLRWVNYLRPDIKRGAFAADEADLIIRLHKLLGNRWALIAGRIPGRTANGIKNHWNSHLSKLVAEKQVDANKGSCSKAIKPQPYLLKADSKWFRPSPNVCGEQQPQQLQEEAAPTHSEGDKSFLFEGGKESMGFDVGNAEGMGSGIDPFELIREEEVEWNDFFIIDNELWSLLESPQKNKNVSVDLEDL